MDNRVNNLNIWYNTDDNNKTFYEAEFNIGKRKFKIKKEDGLILDIDVFAIIMEYKGKYYSIESSCEYDYFADVFNITDNCFVSESQYRKIVPKYIEDTVLNYCILLNEL